MSMTTRTIYRVAGGIIALSVLGSFLAYGKTPDMIASHWGTSGEPDGFMPKFPGLFVLPVMTVVLFFFFLLIPKIDPLKKNIESFRLAYDEFVLVFVLFMVYLHTAMLAWNIGYAFDMGVVVTIGLSFLFIYAGRLLRRSKRNWFIGIRTPWTLSSDRVWEKTHTLGATLFEVGGVLMITAAIFFRGALFPIILAVTIGSSLVSVVYSYVLYRREGHR